MRGGLWAVSRVEGSARARLAFRGLSCWEASAALCLEFPFWAWSMIAVWGCFCSPGGFINGSCGTYWSFLAWGGPFGAVGRGACGLCSKSRARRAHTLASEVYPAGKFQ